MGEFETCGGEAGGSHHDKDKVRDGSQTWVDEAKVTSLDGNLTDLQDVWRDGVEVEEEIEKDWIRSSMQVVRGPFHSS